jgi:hypothetical protein
MGRVLINTYDDCKRCGPRGPSYCVPFLSSLDAGTITPFPGPFSSLCGPRGRSYSVPFLSSLDAGTITPFPGPFSSLCGPRGRSYCVPFLSSLDAGTITPFPGPFSSLCGPRGRSYFVPFLSSLDVLAFLRSGRRLLLTANVVLVHQLLSPWWWKAYVPPKRRFLQELHGVTSQKTAISTVTAVKISNLTIETVYRSGAMKIAFQLAYSKQTLIRFLVKQTVSVALTSWRSINLANWLCKRSWLYAIWPTAVIVVLTNYEYNLGQQFCSH